MIYDNFFLSNSTTTKVHPIVLMEIIQHYNRRNEKENKKVIGALLGSFSSNNAVIIKSSFALEYVEDDENQVQFDSDYLNQMYLLHTRVNPKEKIVGWYATGTFIDTNSRWIHEYFNQNQPQQEYGEMVHLLVDTTFQEKKFDVKAFVSSKAGVPESENPGNMFLEIPCETKYSDAERSALSLISNPPPTPTTPLHVEMENLEKSINQIKSLLAQIQIYIRSTKPKNTSIGRYLHETLSMVKDVDVEKFDEGFKSHVDDLLMVVYLANLTQSQLAVGERLGKLL